MAFDFSSRREEQEKAHSFRINDLDLPFPRRSESRLTLRHTSSRRVQDRLDPLVGLARTHPLRLGQREFLVEVSDDRQRASRESAALRVGAILLRGDSLVLGLSDLGRWPLQQAMKRRQQLVRVGCAFLKLRSILTLVRPGFRKNVASDFLELAVL